MNYLNKIFDNNYSCHYRTLACIEFKAAVKEVLEYRTCKNCKEGECTPTHMENDHFYLQIYCNVKKKVVQRDDVCKLWRN